MPKKNMMKSATLPIIDRGERLYAQVKWAESYVSFLLGLIVVFIFGTIFIFLLRHHNKRLSPDLSVNSKTTMTINVAQATNIFMSRQRFVQSFTAPKRKVQQSVLSDHAYTVKAGDNLWDIALREYRDGGRWVDIMNANNLQSPDYIQEGMILTIPH